MILKLEADDLKDVNASVDPHTFATTVTISLPMGQVGLPSDPSHVSLDVELAPDVISWVQEAITAAAGGTA